MTDARTVPNLFSGPPAYQARSPWGVLPALLATAAICLIGLAGVFVLVATWAALGHSDAEIDRTMEQVSSLNTLPGLTMASATQLASLAMVYILASWKGLRREVLQLATPGPGLATYIKAGLLLIAITGAIELGLWLLIRFDPFADSQWLRDGLRSNYWLGTVVVGVVLAPLWEELTFRGFLLSALAQSRLGFWPAGIVSNVIWTLLHANYSLWGLISVFTAGLVLTWLLWRTGSIKTAIAAHAMGNAVALAFTYFFAPAS